MVSITQETIKTVCGECKVGTRFVEEFLTTQLGFYKEEKTQLVKDKPVVTGFELIWDETVFKGYEKVSFNSFAIQKVIYDDSPGFKTRFTPIVVKAIVGVLPKEFVTSVVKQDGKFKTLIVKIPKEETK